MTIPRTPCELTQPRPRALRASEEGKDGAGGLFGKKVRTGGAENPWIRGVCACKSLIVYTTHPPIAFGFPRVAGPRSTFSSVFSTLGKSVISPSVSLYLSIFKEEEERKTSKKRKPAIHGLAQVLKKASTGRPRVFAPTRGNTWMGFRSRINGLTQLTQAIHASTRVLPVGTFGGWK